jgi:hypothetical protein
MPFYPVGFLDRDLRSGFHFVPSLVNTELRAKATLIGTIILNLKSRVQLIFESDYQAPLNPVFRSTAPQTPIARRNWRIMLRELSSIVAS